MIFNPNFVPIINSGNNVAVDKKVIDAISQIVGTSFIRVCKNNGRLYKILHHSFLTDDKKLFRAPFGKTCQDLFSAFKINASSLYDKRLSSYRDYIGILTNNLIFTYLQNEVQNPAILQTIGEQIYNISGVRINGVKFLQDESQSQNTEDDFMMFCNAEYAHYCQESSSNNRLSFEDFISSCSNDLRKKYKEIQKHMAREMKMPKMNSSVEEYIPDIYYSCNDDFSEDEDFEIYEETDDR